MLELSYQVYLKCILFHGVLQLVLIHFLTHSQKCHCRLQIISRVEQLRDTNVHLSLFPLFPDGGSFNLNSFWRPIIEMLKGDDDDDLGDLDCFGDTLLRLDMIFDVVRKRQNKKRPVASIEWYICSNMKIGVQVA